MTDQRYREIRVPRVCGDDPDLATVYDSTQDVFPAYAGMIPRLVGRVAYLGRCSPRMRG